MTNKKEGLRFKYAESENFMGMPNTIINIDGKSLMVTGSNEVGKSRFIKLLLSGVDPKSQATEITSKGETKASAKTVIAGVLGGESLEYTIEIFYSPKNQSGRLTLYDKKGDKIEKGQKEIIKNLVGNISFDIFAFLNSPKKDKIKVLKELSGVGKEIDILDIQRKEIYDNRTYLGKKIDEKESVMSTHGLTPDQIDLYSEKLLIEPIQEELNSISDKITSWNKINIGVAEFRRLVEVELPKNIDGTHKLIKSDEEEINLINERIKTRKANLVEYDKASEEYKVKLKKGEDWLLKNQEPKANEISQRLSDAMAHNVNYDKVIQLAEKQKELIKDKQTLQKHSDDIVKIDAKKDSLISKSKLPIKDLRFTEDDIFYKNLPLEEGQINIATLYEISLEISKALNPNLRTIFIHAGSLFDKKHLNTVIKKAEADGYQVICELVNDEDKLEIKFTEEEGG